MRIKNCIFFCFLLCYTHIEAQQEKDSLLSIVDKQTDTVKVKTLLELSKILLHSSGDSSFLFSKKALNLSRKLNFEHGILYANNTIGNYYDNIGSYDLSFRHYKEALQIVLKNDDLKGRAIVYSNIGNVFVHKTQIDSAIQMYFIALKAEEKLGDKNGISQAYNNIGVAYYYQQNIPKTLFYLEKANALQEEVGNPDMIKKGYMNISALHLHQKDYNKALSFYFKALDLSRELDDRNDESMALSNIAITYFYKKQFDSSKFFQEKAIILKQSISDWKGLVNSYFNYGELYREKDDLTKAKEYYNKAIQISIEKEGMKYERAELYKALSNSYSSQQKFKEANEYLHLYMLLKDSLHNSEQTEIIANAELKYETEKKDKEIAEKTTSLVTKDLELERGKKRWYVALISFLLMCTLFVVLFFIFRQRQKYRTSKLLIEEKEKGLSAVIHSQEEERKRIAKELHDGVAQQLAGVKMRFDYLQNQLDDNDPMKEELKLSIESLEKANSDVRSISHQMMPLALEESGLIIASEEMFSISLNFSSISYEYQLLGITKTDRFDPQIEVTIYRVAQELTHNIIKHSRAKNVIAQLRKTKSHIIFHLEDDGVGMTKGVYKNGIGMHNIRSRTENIKGDIHFESEKTGTIVDLRIPLYRV